jgi:signal transduction histidine kinase
MAVTEHEHDRRRRPLPGRRAWANRSLRTKGLVVVAIPVTALVVASVLFGVATVQERQAQAAVLRTVEVERQIAQVRRRDQLLDRNKRTVDALNAELDSMRATELAAHRAHARRARVLAFGAIGLSVLLGLAGGLAATWLFTSGVTRRASQLRDNARRLAHREPLSPACPGTDDLGRAGRSLEEEAAVLLSAREQALRQAKDEADRANQAKSEYLSRMSHELRTPLNAILGFAQLLELDELTGEQRENLTHILSGARHLLDLINEVLDIAAIEAGRLRLSPEPVAVADLAAETISLVRPLADQRGILLTAAAVPDATWVLGDRQRLRQILLNLLSNAVKYNHQAGAVTVTCEPAATERLRIKVADTGPGIPAESLERLFVPFERLGYAQSAVEGTGLGLPLARRLAEAMGGALGVTSEPGRGSTFWIELPLSGIPAAAVPAAPL